MLCQRFVLICLPYFSVILIKKTASSTVRLNRQYGARSFFLILEACAGTLGTLPLKACLLCEEAQPHNLYDHLLPRKPGLLTRTVPHQIPVHRVPPNEMATHRQ